MDILGEVRALPQSNRDNQLMTDVDLLSSEVAKFAYEGGRSIVEVTPDGIGRDVVGLQQVSRRSGVQHHRERGLLHRAVPSAQAPHDVRRRLSLTRWCAT